MFSDGLILCLLGNSDDGSAIPPLRQGIVAKYSFIFVWYILHIILTRVTVCDPLSTHVVAKGLNAL
jgi:hypothetical protein